MKRKMIVSLLIAAMAVASFAGCGSEVAQTKGESSGGGGSAASSDLHKEAKNPFEDEVKIAYLPNRASDSVGAAWGVGIENYLSNYENVQYQVFDGEGNADTQISLLSDVLQQEYDAVIIQAVDTSAENNAVQELIDAGITVISLNSSPTIPHTASMTLSSYDFSSQAAELAYSMDDYEANVVIIGYPAEVAKLLIDSPTDAWYDVAEGYENVTILEEQGGDWTTEGANEIMRDFLTKYEDIDIVFAGSDAMAEGAALAIQQAGREGIQVWGLDGESKALEYIEDGLMTGTIYTNYYDMGTLAAQLAMYNIGSTVDLNKQDDMYYYCFPSEIVTADNVETITERW